MMVEPLTVRVERLTGNSRTPIPMPDSDDPNLPQGEGWTKELIRGLEQWLVTEWAGGGLYEFSLRDSSPQPITMTWSSWFDTKDYPSIIPPPLRTQQQQGQIIPLAQPQTQVRPMTAFPHGLPSAGMFQQPQQAGYPQQQYAPFYGPQYQMPPPPPPGTHGYAQWKDDAERRRIEDELHRLRDREMAREREALETKHKAEIERLQATALAERSRNDTAINELRTMIGSLAQTIAQQQTQSKPNSELEEMKRAMAEQAREREAERREALMREQIKAMNDATQRQIEALMRQMELQAQAAREAANNRPDQLVMMMQEQARQNAEMLKEMARNSTDAIKSMQTFMMTPTTMFDLATRQTQALDTTTDKLSRQYSGLIDMQTKIMENALAMQPQGSSAIDVVRDGVQGLKEMVERYTGSKTAEQRINANAQVEIARAQAAVYAASVAQQQGTVHVPPAPQPQSQLSGTPMAQNANAAASTPPTPAVRPIERFGRTDEEWFGPALDEVKQLRDGAARFIESLQQRPPRVGADGMPEGLSPEQCAINVLQAIQFLVQRNIPIQALVDLVMVERFDDFFAVLLPDAPQNYRDDARAVFVETAQRMSGVTEEELAEAQRVQQGDGDGDGDDGDTDGDDDDDGGGGPQPNGKSQPQATVRGGKPPVVVRRGTTTH